uniref:DUF3119 family protein n=1 Tax=Tetradesmus obliquus TaxID=3088 RepID=A0A383VVU7_TETOB
MQSIASRQCAAGRVSVAQTKAVFRPAVAARRPCRVQALWGNKNKTTSSKAAPPKRATVIPEPSLNVPLGLLAISGLSAYEGVTPLAVIAGILGVFLSIQSTRVKFVFDDDSLEVVIAGKEEQETENAFVGGRNRWRYDTFVNWELWWPGFPILVYFKETQTKPEGQIHFFPVIFNGRQLYDVMVERCGPSQNSMPK